MGSVKAGIGTGGGGTCLVVEDGEKWCSARDRVSLKTRADRLRDYDP